MDNALHKNYDKLMNSKNVDVQNINYVGGVDQQQCTVFIKIYFKKTPWAHLDIAGMHFQSMVEHLIQEGNRFWSKIINN